jgi:hypothetical protein
MKVTLLAKSSSGESYQVEFLVDGDSVRVFCHCQAGVLQQMCKHKLALLQGDASMLFDSTQVSVLSEIHAWSQFANLKARLIEFEKRLKEIEVTKGMLLKSEKALKADFVRGLTSGFK